MQPPAAGTRRGTAGDGCPERARARARKCLRMRSGVRFFFFFGRIAAGVFRALRHATSSERCCLSNPRCLASGPDYDARPTHVSRSPPAVAPPYYLFDGYAHLAAGLACGLSALAAGMAIGIVGDAGVRANAQQPKLFVGMILILIFAEALALYGLIVGIILTSNAGSSRDG